MSNRNNMNEEELKYHTDRLKRGELYLNKTNNEIVEFGYMGKTGWAICYEPGDSGGGMQSSFGVRPGNLEKIISK